MIRIIVAAAVLLGLGVSADTKCLSLSRAGGHPKYHVQHGKKCWHSAKKATHRQVARKAKKEPVAFAKFPEPPAPPVAQTGDAATVPAGLFAAAFEQFAVPTTILADWRLPEQKPSPPSQPKKIEVDHSMSLNVVWLAAVLGLVVGIAPGLVRRVRGRRRPSWLSMPVQTEIPYPEPPDELGPPPAWLTPEYRTLSAQ